ncbi:MAG: UDP-N-acetylglucosamine 2-epimerase [Parcubacteria group bacterium Gr01-1014_66]|nr:MAG: UDP-N-acetylglucosamine 2-epimerase [Parcubacteria group bacterium Gr01-1014_66]
MTSRIHYARQKNLLQLLRDDPQIELQLVVGGSALLERYSERFLPAIQSDGFTVHETLFNVIEGGNHVTMAKTAGLTALEFANTLSRLNPDLVLIRGDRFEQLALTMVAAYLNKTIAHIEGGDVTGTIDESVRHAITKLAHVHFVTNDDARRRVLQMGENPEHVFNVGSLDVEFAASVNTALPSDFVNRGGVGTEVDLGKPYLMVIQHPVTTETDNRKNIEQTLHAVEDIGMQTVWFWPNSDAGTAEMAKAIRVFREQANPTTPIRFVTDVLPEDFIALLKGAACLVGNSSSGIKESSYLGTPVVNIGTRQHHRLRGQNVVDVGYDRETIAVAIQKQLTHGAYPSSTIYYTGATSNKIAEILIKAPLAIQKEFFVQQ